MVLRFSIQEPEKNIMPETMIFVIFLKNNKKIKIKHMSLFSFTENKPHNANWSKEQKEKHC